MYLCTIFCFSTNLFFSSLCILDQLVPFPGNLRRVALNCTANARCVTLAWLNGGPNAARTADWPQLILFGNDSSPRRVQGNYLCIFFGAMGAYNKQFVAPECTNFASLKINCSRSRRDKPQWPRETRDKRPEGGKWRVATRDCRLETRAKTETVSEENHKRTLRRCIICISIRLERSLAF